MQIDELMEYAFPRSNGFHFATASIASNNGVRPPPFWTSMWFAAYSPASPSNVLAEIDERRRKELMGFLVSIREETMRKWCAIVAIGALLALPLWAQQKDAS
ncbi:MAG TPA: hypothetical protein VNY24_04505, partial [Candidatus Acidoferrales bacterium]|nr:hypothetical protein [Candidatus Acidoferrales bacterium]